jgi:hypothetical protein
MGRLMIVDPALLALALFQSALVATAIAVVMVIGKVKALVIRFVLIIMWRFAEETPVAVPNRTRKDRRRRCARPWWPLMLRPDATVQGYTTIATDSTRTIGSKTVP